MIDTAIGATVGDVGIKLKGLVSFPGISDFASFDGWSAKLSLLRTPGGRAMIDVADAEIGPFDPVAGTLELSYVTVDGDISREGTYHVRWALAGPDDEMISVPSPLVGQRYVEVDA
jgi:hypothetical protein